MDGLFSIKYVLFTIGGQNVSLIELLAVVFGISCVYLATRAKVLNFWVGYAYTIFLFFLFLQKELYSSMLLQPVSLAINMYGHYRWTHPKEGEQNQKNQLKITLMTNRERIGAVVLILIIAFIWGMFLSEIHNVFPDVFRQARTPYLDAFVTIVILAAQYLSAQKKLECWAAWFTVNITNITLYILAGLVFMPMVSASYLVLAFFGFSMWQKQWKANN